MGLGQLMKAVRTDRGWTAEECAARMGVSQPAWSDWENGKVRQARPDTIRKIAKALDQDPDDFLSAVLGDKNAKPAVRLGHRLERHLSGLPEEKREIIEQMLEDDAKKYRRLFFAAA